jgi:hypothetical protein
MFYIFAYLSSKSMPKTVSVPNTFNEIQTQMVANQRDKLKKKIPALFGTGILIHRFSFRVSDYFMVVCNISVQANIELII